MHDSSLSSWSSLRSVRPDRIWLMLGCLRLSRALGLSERYWINMQIDYDIETEHDLHEEELRQVEVLVPLRPHNQEAWRITALTCTRKRLRSAADAERRFFALPWKNGVRSSSAHIN